MKIESKVRDVSAEGLENVTNFKFKVSGKAFRILLDGLYSNKIKAILRELGTNAYDGHLAAGCGDKPFDVQLPNTFDPTFRVRDYGCSMSDDDVMNLYSTLFDSSKDNRNDQVGMLGLGSKSPFAYADQFTVTTWHGGMKRVYNAFISADGIPHIARMSEEPSTEASGVEVSLIAQARDVKAFIENAAEVYRWFPVKPNIIGAAVTFPKDEVVMEGKGWRLCSSYTARHTALARQGCVAYPIDKSAIPGLSGPLAALLDSPLTIDFPIGTLDVAPSREALSYGEETCRNIVARLNSVSKEIVDRYGSEVAGAKTLWEAGAILSKMQATRLPSSIFQIVAAMKWGGVSINHGVEAHKLMQSVFAKNPASTSMIFLVDRYRADRVQSIELDATARRAVERRSIAYGSNHIFFVRLQDKKPTYEGLRLKEAWNAHKAKHGFSAMANIVVLSAADEASAQELLDGFGNPPFTYTHDLPKPNIARATTNRATGTTKRNEVKVREYDVATNKWADEKTVDITGDAYYVLTKNARVINSSGFSVDFDVYDDRFGETIRAAVASGCFKTDRPIYAISTTYETRLSTTPSSWLNLVEVLDGSRSSLEAAYEQEILGETLHNEFRRSVWLAILKDLSIADHAKRQPDGTPLRALYDLTQFLNTVPPSTGRNTVYRNILDVARLTSWDRYELCQRVRTKCENHQILQDMRKLTLRCEQEYPLMRRFDVTGELRIFAKDLINYFKGIDLLNSTSVVTQTTSLKAAA